VSNTAGTQASIGNGQTMNADAAACWTALRAAVFEDIGVWVIATEGTRTYARQLYLWDHRNEPGFNPAWHPDSPYAYHLSGRAVDVGSGVGFLVTLASQAFYRRAGEYGFRATVPGEPWHFEWRSEWVAPQHRNPTTPASSGAVPIDPEEDQMTEEERKTLNNIAAAVTRLEKAVVNDDSRLAKVAQSTDAIREATVGSDGKLPAHLDAVNTHLVAKIKQLGELLGVRVK